jgi:multidrug efflux system membrane fusion protein
MFRAFVILMVLSIVGGIYTYQRQHGLHPVAAATPATAATPAPTVKTARAETYCLPVYARGIGRVEPFNDVQLKSRVDGQIERVLYTEGEEVKSGQVLVEIDPRPYQAAVAQAEGQLARDQAQLVAAKADLERSTSLVQKGFATHQTFDQQSSLVGQFTAAIRTDQAVLDNARLNLGFASIRAPIGGRIGKRLVDAGNMIHQADNTVLAEIVQIHPIAVTFTVPQDALPEIQARQKPAPLRVEILNADDQHVLAAGDLTLIGNTIDPATGTIALKAVVENNADTLWPGQFVTARVITSLRNDAVAVPLAAIEPGPDGKFVYVVDSDSKVQARPVKLGQPARGLAVIESGLAPDEAVVLDRQDALKPGMLVAAEEQAVAPTICAADPAMRRS